MNRKTVTTLVAGVVIAGVVALAATKLQQSTPAPAPQPVGPAPKLLSLEFDKALKVHQALVEEAERLSPDNQLPTPVAHSAGANAVAKMEAREEAAPPAPPVDASKSIALWFSGNSVGETDPCG